MGQKCPHPRVPIPSVPERLERTRTNGNERKVINLFLVLTQGWGGQVYPLRESPLLMSGSVGRSASEVP